MPHNFLYGFSRYPIQRALGDRACKTDRALPAPDMLSPRKDHRQERPDGASATSRRCGLFPSTCGTQPERVIIWLETVHRGGRPEHGRIRCS